MEIKNAKITDARLFIEDHDILIFMIHLDLGAACCGVGGFALDQAVKIDDDWNYEFKASSAGLECMRKIMDVVGVRNWADLKGKYVRYEDNGLGSSVTKIGHIMENKWIYVKEFFKNYNYEDWIQKFRR